MNDLHPEPQSGFQPTASPESKSVSNVFSQVLVDLLSSSEDDRFVVACYEHTPSEVLDILAISGSGDVLDRVVRNRNCSSSSLDRIVAAHPPLAVSAASNPNLSDALFEIFSIHPQSDVRVRVAQNPAIPVPLLSRLAEDGNEWVRGAALANPRCPSRLVNWAAQTDMSSNVVCSAARNPVCAPQVLQVLSSRDALVRYAVASNPGCPPQLLTVLASDDDIDVKCAVAQNPACPPEILWKFLEDDVAKMFVLINPAAPEGFAAAAVEDTAYDIQMAASSSEYTPADVLALLAASDEPNATINVLRNPSCPAELLRQESTSQDFDVAQSVALSRSPDPFLTSFRASKLYAEDTRGVFPRVSLKQALLSTTRFLLTDTDPVSVPVVQHPDLTLNFLDGHNVATFDRAAGLVAHCVGLATAAVFDPAGVDQGFFKVLFDVSLKAGLEQDQFTSAQLLTLRKVSADAGWDFPNVSVTKTRVVSKPKGPATNIFIR